MVERQYQPGSLVHVVQYTHLYNVLSKLNPKLFGLCKVFEVRGLTLTLRNLDTNNIFTACHDAKRASTLFLLEILLQADPPAEPANTQNAGSSVENFESGRVENLRLFADDEWLSPSASQISSLTDLDLTTTTLSVLHCRRQNLLLVPSVMSDFLHVSCLQSRVPLFCRYSRVSLPFRCSSRSHQHFNFAQLRLDRADVPSHLAQVRKKARILVLITSGSVMTNSYGGYLVATSTSNSSNSEPTPPRAANCCIDACRGPQLQSSRD